MSFTIEHADEFKFQAIVGWPNKVLLEAKEAVEDEDTDHGWITSLVVVNGRVVEDHNTRMLFGRERKVRLDRFTGYVTVEVSQQRCTGDQYDHAAALIAQGRNIQRILEAFGRFE